MNRMTFEPIRISCRPQALYYERDRWLKLDSLLLKAVLIEKYGALFAELPPIFPSTSQDELEYPDTMPLARRERAGQWYYACSWADVEAVTVQTFAGAYVRRFSEEAVRRYADHRGRGRFVVHLSKGADKSVHETAQWRVVTDLTWYAFGDAAEIARLLNAYFISVGKKESQGCGQLCAYSDGAFWRVTPIDRDYSERNESGQLTRGLPIEQGGVMYPIRPPYYVRANYVPTELPE